MKATQEGFENSVTFRFFSDKIPKWGGEIEIDKTDFGALYDSYRL